jgi:hypothetical protein
MNVRCVVACLQSQKQTIINDKLFHLHGGLGLGFRACVCGELLFVSSPDRLPAAHPIQDYDAQHPALLHSCFSDSLHALPRPTMREDR